jgi:hypothetical protein
LRTPKQRGKNSKQLSIISKPSAASFPGPAGINTNPLGLREKSRVKAEAARLIRKTAEAILLNIGKIPLVRYY